MNREQVRIYLDKENIKYIKEKGGLSKIINDLISKVRKEEK